MADRNLAIQLIISAKDTASGVFAKIVSAVKFLDSEISVVAGKIREKFSDLFGGGLDGAKEFEAQLDKVQAKGDYTAESMARLKQAAVEVGAKFGLTGTEAAQGMESLAAAGLNATQVMQALPPVLALAKAEGISMDAAAEKLSDSLSIMGLGFEQAGKMADVLAKGANVSTTSASALAQALSTVGGIARTAGLDLEQTVGALSALANAGIKGERAGTALAAILTQLTNPASAASKELSALGITTRDLGEVVGQLAAKGDASNSAILAFGETAGPGLRALIGQGQQSLNDLIGQLRNADGAAQQAADGIGGNLKGALKGLQSAWDNVKAALFDPVLEPLTKAANDAAIALNTQLIGGALKPAQAAVKEFAVNSIQAARDFIAGFDFKGALQSLQSFAAGSAESFKSIASAGKTSADVITIAWNAVTAGFRTVGSALLAVAASAVQTLANMEEVASHIGLGTQQRANELRETANGLQAKATELINQVATDGRELQAAYDRLTTSTDGAGAANQRLKDSLPAAELQTINKSLADYATIADRANAAAKQAQDDFFAGKISMEQLAAAADAAAIANTDLEDATRRDAEQQAAAAAAGKKAAEQHKATAVELQAVAKASQDAADRQGTYTGALEQASNASAAAIRAEINLALAKGDTATAAEKSVQLAQSEAEWAKRIAVAKATEADELQKVVVAQQAYLAAVGGGTAAQQQELQILQLKAGALQAEAAQAGATAETKAVAAQQTQKNTEETKKNTEETEHHIVALKKDSEEQQTNTKHTNDGSAALAGLAARLQALRDEMDKLSESARLYFEAQNQWNLAHVGIEGAAQAARDAQAAFQSLGDSASKALAGYNKEIAFAQEGIDHWKDKLGFATTGFEKFETAMELAALQTKKLWNEQARDAEIARQSIERMTESGNIQMGVLKTAIQGVNGGFTLLDQQDLSGLQSAIDGANNKLREMQQEANDARSEIARLNAEIASEQGDTEKAALLKQQLDYQEALADIEAKRSQAELEGNRELVALYEEQARKLNELNALKEKNIKAEARANQEAENAARNSAQNTATATTGIYAAANQKRVADERLTTSNLYEINRQYSANLVDLQNQINDDMEAAIATRLAAMQQATAAANTAMQQANAETQAALEEVNTAFVEGTVAASNAAAAALDDEAAAVQEALAQATAAAEEALATARAQYLTDTQAAIDAAQAAEVQAAEARAAGIAQAYADAAEALDNLLAETAEATEAATEASNERLTELAENLAQAREDIHQETLAKIADAEQAHVDAVQAIETGHRDRLAEIEADYLAALVNAKKDLAESLVELNESTNTALSENAAGLAEELSSIQDDFADHVLELNSRIAEETQSAVDALAAKAEELRRDVLEQQGEYGQLAVMEFGDELQKLIETYARAGEAGRDDFEQSVTLTEQLNQARLDGLLESEKITQEQYDQAVAESQERITDIADQLAAAQAAVQAEKDARLAKLAEERDEQIASANAVFEARRLKIIEESDLKKAQLIEEAELELAQIETTHLERLAAEEAAYRERQRQEEESYHAEMDNLDALYAKKLVDLQAEYDAKKAKEEADLIDKIAKLEALKEEKAWRINAAADLEAARQERLYTETLDQIAAELEVKKTALSDELAEREAAIATELTAKKAAIATAHQEALDKIAAELEVKKIALAEELAQRKADLATAHDEALAKIADELAQKKLAIAAELVEKKAALKAAHDQAMADLAAEHAAAALANSNLQDLLTNSAQHTANVQQLATAMDKLARVDMSGLNTHLATIGTTVNSLRSSI